MTVTTRGTAPAEEESVRRGKDIALVRQMPGWSSIPVAFAIHPLAAVGMWFVGPILSSLPGHRSLEL